MIVGFDATDLSSKLGKHLSNATDNEEVEFRFHDLAATNVQDALKLWRAATSWVSTNKPGVHCWASPKREMTDEQWDRFWLTFEREVGVEGEPFVEATHLKIGKGGRVVRHKHRIYLRLNPDGTAIPLNHCAARAEKLARLAEHDNNQPFVRGRYNRSVIAHLKEEGRLEVAAAMEAEGLHLAERPAATSRSERSQTARLQDISAGEAKRRAYVAWAGSSNAIELEKNLAKQGLHIALGDTCRAVILTERGAIYRLSAAVSSGAKALGAPKVRAAAVHALTAELSLQPVDVVKANLPEVPPVRGWTSITGAERSVPLLSLVDRAPNNHVVVRQEAGVLCDDNRKQELAIVQDETVERGTERVPSVHVDPPRQTAMTAIQANEFLVSENVSDRSALFGESQIVFPKQVDTEIQMPVPEEEQLVEPFSDVHTVSKSPGGIENLHVEKPAVQPIPLEMLTPAQRKVLSETAEELDKIIFQTSDETPVETLSTGMEEINAGSSDLRTETPDLPLEQSPELHRAPIEFSLKADPVYRPEYRVDPESLMTFHRHLISAIERIDSQKWHIRLKDGSSIDLTDNQVTVRLAPEGSFENAMRLACDAMRSAEVERAFVVHSTNDLWLAEKVARASVRNYLPITNENLALECLDEEMAMYAELTMMADHTGGGEYFEECRKSFRAVVDFVLYFHSESYADLVIRNGATEYLRKDQLAWLKR
ncbi:MAG TPA: hypothetical protein P5307_07630, partial [Pirellulaceae bacterium]|nr:hypothetical protein [Pirellulaceae bacterium]